MLILDALNLNVTTRRPVWVMRQAGRYMASFRALRQKHSFLDICRNADLSTQVSLLPMKQYSFDASIVFSDILIPWQAVGVDLKFGEDGPALGSPRSVDELSKIRLSFDPHSETPVILETIQNLRREIPKEKAVLGFAGAPWTMLAYLLEGKISKDLGVIKRWMAEQPKLIHQVLDKLSASLAAYLEAQAQAGADAVQLFDTWASVLGPEAYEEFALPYARKVLSAVTVPSIYYVNGVSGLLDQLSGVGAQCLSVDWRVRLKDVRAQVSHVMAIQGNLDPYDLHLPKAAIRQKVFDLCESYGTSPGHIVNLGHGIVPSIPEDSVKVFVDAVHEWSAQKLQ